MARPLRVEFPGAVYHVTSRGHARHGSLPVCLVSLVSLVCLVCLVSLVSWFVWFLSFFEPNQRNKQDKPNTRDRPLRARHADRRTVIFPLSCSKSSHNYLKPLRAWQGWFHHEPVAGQIPSFPHAPPCGLSVPLLEYASLRGPYALLDSPLPSLSGTMLRHV